MTRKMKLLIIIMAGTIISIALYLFLLNKKINIISIGDSILVKSDIKTADFLLKDYYENKNILNRFNNDYCIQNMTTGELLNMITKNVKNKNNLTIQQLIGTSDIVIISIGKDEINSGENINTYIYNMEKIVKQLASINKKKIYLIGFIETNNKIKDINYWLESICKKYNAIFIEIDNNYAQNEKIIDYDEDASKEIYQKIIDNK